MCGDTGALGEEGTRTQSSELQFDALLSNQLRKTDPGWAIPVTQASYSEVLLARSLDVEVEQVLALLKTLIRDHNSLPFHPSLAWPPWQPRLQVPSRVYGWDQDLCCDTVPGEPAGWDLGK